MEILRFIGLMFFADQAEIIAKHPIVHFLSFFVQYQDLTIEEIIKTKKKNAKNIADEHFQKIPYMN